MFKMIKFIVMFILIFSILPASSYAADEPVKIFIHNKKVEFNQLPFIEKSTTMVEFRSIFELLGLTLEYNADTKMVTGIKEGLEIKLKLGEKTAYVNGEPKELLVEPKLHNNYTFIPLRFISEAIGADIEWNEENNEVFIYLTLEEKLLNSVLKNDLARAKSLLKQGADPNYIDNGRTLLEWAIPFHPEMVKLLLENGANPNVKTSTGDSLLHLAILYANPEIVKVLIDNKADLIAKGANGETPYQLAIGFRNYHHTNENSNSSEYIKKYDQIINLLEEDDNFLITNGEELQEYLSHKYTEIPTKLITIPLDIRVFENDNLNRPYDYYINFYYDITMYHPYINSYRNSIKNRETGVQDAEQSFKQIKQYIENVAKDIISKMPNKKFFGNTQHEWYTYPNIKIDLNIARENSWINFEPKTPKVKDQYNGKYYYTLLTYDETVVSEFKWVPDEDIWTFDQ